MYQFKHLFQNSYQYNTVSNRSKRGDSLVRKTNCSITIVFTLLLFILPPPSFYTAESFYLIHLLLTGFHVMGTLGFTNNQDFAHRALIDFMPLMSVYTLSKHQKTNFCDVFRGLQKQTIGMKRVNLVVQVNQNNVKMAVSR